MHGKTNLFVKLREKEEFRLILDQRFSSKMKLPEL